MGRGPFSSRACAERSNNRTGTGQSTVGPGSSLEMKSSASKVVPEQGRGVHAGGSGLGASENTPGQLRGGAQAECLGQGLQKQRGPAPGQGEAATEHVGSRQGASVRGGAEETRVRAEPPETTGQRGARLSARRPAWFGEAQGRALQDSLVWIS